MRRARGKRLTGVSMGKGVKWGCEWVNGYASEYVGMNE